MSCFVKAPFQIYMQRFDMLKCLFQSGRYSDLFSLIKLEENSCLKAA